MNFLRHKIVGTWKLVSWVYKNEKGQEVDYFGKNCVGILMYDDKGYMNTQVMKADRQPFVSESISGGTPTETYEAFHSYISYFGRYYEENPGEMIHIVEGSLFPNWIGNKQVRYGRIEGDKLIFTTPPIQAQGTEIIFCLTWKRV